MAFCSMTIEPSSTPGQGPAPRLAPRPGETFARKLRGFGPMGVAAILVVLLIGNVSIRGFTVPLGALLAIAWTWLSRTPWSEIGCMRPKSWAVSTVVAIILGGAFKLAMKALVMPLLGAPAINSTYHYLKRNRAALPGAVFTMIVAAGLGEETVFRGFLFDRMGHLLGRGAGAKTVILVLTAVRFGLAHYSSQGLSGTEQATIVGLVFGMLLAITSRIWPLMCAHAAFDLTALAIIYFDLETRVACLVFP